jgi:hypothetical protein
VSPDELPDLVARARAWLDAPTPIRGRYDASRIGAALLRQLEQHGPPGGVSPMRASQLGDCRRAIAYRVAGTPTAGREIDGVSRMTFAIGDTVEALLGIAIEESLPDGWSLRYTRDEQHHGLWTTPEGLAVPTHADGLGRMADGTGFTIEIKSAAGYKLDSWRRSGWGRDTSYRWQVHAQQAAYRVRWTYVAAVDKGTATLWGQWIEWDDAIDADARAHLLGAQSPPEQTPRVLPDGTELGPTEPAKTEKDRRRVLPWQCRYCAFWRTCWPEAEEGWTSRSKPTLRVPDEVTP